RLPFPTLATAAWGIFPFSNPCHHRETREEGRGREEGSREKKRRTSAHTTASRPRRRRAAGRHATAAAELHPKRRLPEGEEYRRSTAS
ncbi:unnamed protein product, partial [Urochloa humidicola]